MTDRPSKGSNSIIAVPAEFARTTLLTVNRQLSGELARAQALVQRLEKQAEQHKATELKLEEVQQQLELILNSAGEGIQGLDVGGRVIFENRKAAELLGWHPEELLGKPAHETIHHKHADGRDYPRHECQIHATIGTGGTRHVSNDVFWRKDGSCFRVDYIVAPMKAADGRVIGAIVTFRDITQDVAATARAKLREEQYRLVFKSNPNPMWVFDTSTLRILAVNDAAVRQYGYTAEEFLQLSLTDLRVAEERQKLLDALSGPKERAHFTGQFEHLRKDGSRFYADIYSSPVVWDGITARMVTAIDCTQRKETETRLRRQAEMLDHARDAISMRRLDDATILFWNKGAQFLYGWTAEEAIGARFNELVQIEPAEFENATKNLAETGEYRGEFKCITRNEEPVVVAVWSTLIDGWEGAERCVLSIHTNITEQKKLEQQFLRAQRLESIGTLASGVAHDLNNIITPIMMSAPLLREHQDEETREKLVQLIEASASRGAKLVNQVVTFARGIEGERVLLQPEHLIDDVAKIATQTFPKNITVRTRYQADLWAIEGDATQLHQILLNLAVNARDAMPNGGTLTLGAAKFAVDPSFAAMMPGASAGAHVMLTVADTGTGIPRDIIDKIFDPFFTTKELGKGTGLGLSTVVGIAKSHGGFVNVYSEIGHGTTFKVFLPSACNAAQASASIELEKALPGEGETILVVEDEDAIRRVTETMLSQYNYRVLTASDGTEGLALFATHMHDVKVVLTDIAMPHMDGVTLTRALKKMKPNVHVIASTGRSDDPQINELAAAGVAACLSKPYNTAHLLQTLHRLLSPS